MVMTIVLTALSGWFFLLLFPCLPAPYVYFAFNRYDADGNEKLDS